MRSVARPFISESCGRLAERRKAGEGSACRLKVAEVRIGHSQSAPATGAVTRVDRHDPIRAVGRQTARHRVHDGEHRPVHADPERQCQDCREGEPAVFEQQASGQPEIVRHTSGLYIYPSIRHCKSFRCQARCGILSPLVVTSRPWLERTMNIPLRFAGVLLLSAASLHAQATGPREFKVDDAWGRDVVEFRASAPKGLPDRSAALPLLGPKVPARRGNRRQTLTASSTTSTKRTKNTKNKSFKSVLVLFVVFCALGVVAVGRRDRWRAKVGVVCSGFTPGSFRSQRHHRIDTHRSPRGEIRAEHRRGENRSPLRCTSPMTAITSAGSRCVHLTRWPTAGSPARTSVHRSH